MLLTFVVRQQTISMVETGVQPRQGSSGYLKLKFNFASEEWRSLDKTLYLASSNYSEPFDLTSDTFEVPAYYTQQQSFTLTLLGSSDTAVVPTNVLEVSLSPSNKLWKASPPDPQNSAYLRLIELVQSYGTRIEALEKRPPGSSGAIDPEDIKEAVDEYLAENPPAAGPQGEKGDPGKTPVKGEDYFTPEEVQEIAEQAAQLVEVPDSGGLTKTEKDLIITLFRNASYISGDVDDSFTQLKTIWGYVYNITDYSTIQGYPGATVGAVFGGTTEGGTTIYFPVVEGSTYTISRTTTLPEKDRFRFAFSETEPASNVVTLWYQNSDLRTNVTVTAPANARYLMVYVGGNSYPTIPDGFTVTEEGR